MSRLPISSNIFNANLRQQWVGNNEENKVMMLLESEWIQREQSSLLSSFSEKVAKIGSAFDFAMREASPMMAIAKAEDNAYIP